MGNVVHSKTFKSGNSVALRLPKSLGFDEGENVSIVQHEDGSVTIIKAADRREMLLSLYGRFSPGFMSEGRGDIEQDERNWSRPISGDAA